MVASPFDLETGGGVASRPLTPLRKLTFAGLGLPISANRSVAMSKRSQRTPGLETAHPFAGLQAVNPHAAGVDIGASEIVACVAGNTATPQAAGAQLLRAFGVYTVDLLAIADWFRAQGITTIAMESTGVYWIPLFELLESQGFTCLLISARTLRRVPGKKSDISDAQWIQTLHQYGLLAGSFRPEAELIALRTLLRHRAQLIEHRAPHILHMQ
jgi:hypothetical protein